MDGPQVPPVPVPVNPFQFVDNIVGDFLVQKPSAHSINLLEFSPADSAMPPKLPFVNPNVVSASVFNDCYGEYHGGYHGENHVRLFQKCKTFMSYLMKIA